MRETGQDDEAESKFIYAAVGLALIGLGLLVVNLI